MKIHVLMENRSSRPELTAEHGLSLLIECRGKCILFDTGASPAFADNAERLGLDLSKVDAAVLSHGHYDHGGGLLRFLRDNHQAPVWVSPHAFDPHFNARGKDIGLPPGLKVHPQIRRVAGEQHTLYEGMTIYSAVPLPCTYPTEGSGMTAVIDGRSTEDDFRHEQYLLLEEGSRRVLISGCSHRGILNIAAHFRPDVLVGGFHLMRTDPVKDAPRLLEIARQLLAIPAQYHTGHCTGEGVCALLCRLMGERLQTFSTGMHLEL